MKYLLFLAERKKSSLKEKVDLRFFFDTISESTNFADL